MPDIANPLTARMHKGANTTCDEGMTLLPVAFNWQNGGGYGEAHDGLGITEDGVGDGVGPLSCSQTPAVAFRAAGQDGFTPAEVSPPLLGTDGGGAGIPVAFSPLQGGRSMPVTEECPTLEAGTGNKAAVTAFDTTQITHPENRSNPQPGDPCHPLAAGAHPPAICIHADAVGRDGVSVTPGPDAEGRVRLRDAGLGIIGDGSTYSLTTGQPHAVAQSMAVRRITPREAERLQGFPDGYTEILHTNGKPAADGPRYKALGNSMAVPVMAWIGRRIQLVEKLAPRSDHV